MCGSCLYTQLDTAAKTSGLQNTCTVLPLLSNQAKPQRKVASKEGSFSWTDEGTGLRKSCLKRRVVLGWGLFSSVQFSPLTNWVTGETRGTIQHIFFQSFLQEAIVSSSGMGKEVHSLTVARGGSCGPTRKLILLRTQQLVLCSMSEMRRNFLRHLVSKVWILFISDQLIS